MCSSNLIKLWTFFYFFAFHSDDAFCAILLELKDSEESSQQDFISIINGLEESSSIFKNIMTSKGYI